MSWARRVFRSRPGILGGLVVTTGAGFGAAGLLPQPAGGGVAMLLVLGMIFWIARSQAPGLRAIGLGRPASWPRTLALGVLYSVVAFVLFRLALEGLLERLTGVERDLSRFGYLEGNLGALLGLVPVLWLTAAFFEEIYFRGYLIPQIAALFGDRRRRLGLATGAILSAALFALAHGYQALSGVLLTGIGALFFALIFLGHRQNLWIPILVHGVYDTTGAVLMYLGVYERATRLLF